MSLAGDDDDPRTELNVEAKTSHVGPAAPSLSATGDEDSAISHPAAARSVAIDALPADDEPKTMEPRTLDPRLGIRPLVPAPLKAMKAQVPATPVEREGDGDDEPSIQTIEARVVDAHKGVVEKVKKSPTMRGIGPASSAAVADADAASADDDAEDHTELDTGGEIAAALARAGEVETVTASVPSIPAVVAAEPASEADEEDVTALDTSLLSGGLALAATAARAAAAKPAPAVAPFRKPIARVDDDAAGDDPPTALVRPPPTTPETLPSTDLITEPGLAKPAPPRAPAPRPAPSPQPAKPIPEPANRTLEMPRPAFVKPAPAPNDPAVPRGPKGTAKIVGGNTGATPVSFAERAPGGLSESGDHSTRGGGMGALAVTLLVAAAFVVGVLATLYLVKRGEPSAASDPPPASSIAVPADTSLPPVASSVVPSSVVLPSASAPSATATSAHKSPAWVPPGPVRPATKPPAPRSSTPMHL